MLTTKGCPPRREKELPKSKTRPADVSGERAGPCHHPALLLALAVPIGYSAGNQVLSLRPVEGLVDPNLHFRGNRRRHRSVELFRVGVSSLLASPSVASQGLLHQPHSHSSPAL